MNWYRAKIVDYEHSKKKPGQYYPVFEYKDEYGELRTYTRKKYMEVTPFTADKTYTICKKDFHTHESTEKKLAPRVYFFAIRILMLIVAFFNPSLVLFTVAVNTFTRLGYHCFKFGSAWDVSRSRDKMQKINGMIIGYKKVKRRGVFAPPTPMYRPLISYDYQGQTFVHIGRIACEAEQKIKGTICKIYVDKKRKLVIDEFEINAPIIALPSWSKESIEYTCSNIKDRTERLKETIAYKKEMESARNIGTPSPLRLVEYKKAANWY